MTDFYNPKTQTNDPQLTVCGTSARWLAQSATAAGFEVTAFDQFSDWDLQHSCHRFARFDSESELHELLSSNQISSLLVGSGLETNFDVYTKWANLFGWSNASANSIRYCRDPFFWTEYLEQHQFETAKLEPQFPNLAKYDWVFKPFDSTGGVGISFAENDSFGNKGFWQEYIQGQPISSLHLAEDEKIHTLGIFLQLIGSHQDAPRHPGIQFADDVFNAKPFHYAGAIGPLNLHQLDQMPLCTARLNQIASALMEATGVRGVFGIDWIAKANGTAIPLEINPRFPSTAELWEFANQQNAVLAHLAAICRQKRFSASCLQPKAFGKAIVFNPFNKFKVSKKQQKRLIQLCQTQAVADIPNVGSVIEIGEPIVTVFSDRKASQPGEIHNSLVDRTNEVLELLETI